MNKEGAQAESFGDQFGDQEDLTKIISDLEDLVRVAAAAEKNEVEVSLSSFVDVHKKLMNIYKMIEEYRKNYADALRPLGLTPEDMRARESELSELKPQQKKMMEKLQHLQHVCEEARGRVYESLQQNVGATRSIKEELKGDERQTIRRKGKFKGVGGKKGWMPT